VLVTGASSGIGLNITEKLADHRLEIVRLSLSDTRHNRLTSYRGTL
jgi:NADP-dependent 3-hydroxy acid dehydrogenase YdfG